MKTIREEEAMLKSKWGRRSESVVGIRVASTDNCDPEIELPNTQMSQLIEMMAGPSQAKPSQSSCQSGHSHNPQVVQKSRAAGYQV